MPVIKVYGESAAALASVYATISLGVGFFFTYGLIQEISGIRPVEGYLYLLIPLLFLFSFYEYRKSFKINGLKGIFSGFGVILLAGIGTFIIYSVFKK